MRQSAIPSSAVSVRQMQRIDEAAIRSFGIPRLLLMDHAGQAVAEAVRSLIPDPPQDLLVCCGTGYNGGDGLCAATYLARWGHHPHVVVSGSVEGLKEEPSVYARILGMSGVPVLQVTTAEQLSQVQEWFAKAGAIVDALLGIGLQGPARPPSAELITLINRANKPVVSADIPSGLHGDTGLAEGEAVKATVTVTFGLPKQGLFLGDGPAHTGNVLVDDIGIPACLLSGGGG